MKNLRQKTKSLLAALLSSSLFLASCAHVPPPKSIYLSWIDKDKKPQWVQIELRYSNFVPFEKECREFLIGMPIACNTYWEKENFARMILPVWANQWLVMHEIGHVMRCVEHPLIFPILETWNC